MSNADEHDAEQLSALADGELDSATVGQVCGRWSAGAPAHATWHAYHLIGDVLRSEDLARAAHRDHEALERFRARMAAEPVMLAPVPATRLRSGYDESRAPPMKRRWGTAAAIAAGFAAVGGVLFALRAPTVGEPSITLARGGVVGNAMSLGDSAAQPTVREMQIKWVDGRLVRDPSLDRYLDAHKHFSGSSALGVPSSFLRGATTDATAR